MPPPCRRRLVGEGEGGMSRWRGRREGWPVELPPPNDALNELIVDSADAPVELEFTLYGSAQGTIPSVCGESDGSG